MNEPTDWFNIMLDGLRAKALFWGATTEQHGDGSWSVRFDGVLRHIKMPDTSIARMRFQTEFEALDAYLRDQKSQGYPHLNNIEDAPTYGSGGGGGNITAFHFGKGGGK